MEGRDLFFVLGLLFLTAALVAILFGFDAWFFTFIIMGAVSMALSMFLRNGDDA